MSSTSAPFGLRPISHPSGVIRQDTYPNGVASGYASAIYSGTPIKYHTDGTLIVTATGADNTVGVFLGAEWTSAGRFFVSPYWPAAQTYDNDGTMQVYFTSDKNITYEAQCDGSVAQTANWETINLVDSSASGSVYTGQSTQRLNHTTTGATAGTFQVTGVSPYQGNTWGDTYTIVRVQISTYSVPVT